MRQIKIWLTAISALLCSLTASAHDFSVGGIYYNITSSTDLTVAVTYRGNSDNQYSNEYSGAVTIPSTVTYNSKTYSVTSIGDYAFSRCSSLTSITIPEGVTNIEYQAFYNCSSLTSITIPESVTSIGSYAFENCSSLTSINIPEGVTSIGYNAFYNTAWYDNQPDGVIYAGRVLYKYKGTMPANTSVEVKEGTVSIGSSAFDGCSSLTSITLPESVTSIGNWAFYNCSSLTSITLPESVTSIGSYAFYNCSSLNGAFISAETPPTIGTSVFYDNSIYIYVPASSVEAYKSAEGWSGYKNIQSTDLIRVDGIWYEFITKAKIAKVISGPVGIKYAGFISIPATVTYEGVTYSVTSIGEKAFYECISLTSITIPENSQLTSIGDRAFYDCRSLTSVTIPESVTSIGYDAFEGCNSLEQVTINCANVGDWFRGLSSLKEVVLGESVTRIGNYAFDNCTSLKKVTFEDGSSTLSLGYNSSQGLFYDCPLEEVYLGRNLSYSSGSSYGYSPFYNKDALTNVTIGNEVTQISEYAFYSCDNIHSLTISSGVLSIGSNAFSTPEKVIWLTNTPPTGYTNAQGSINYVANDLYTSLSNVKVYPYLSSMFEVDGVKYVPVSPSERTCHAIDCAYDSTAESINVSETASFKGIAMTVKEVMPYTFYGNKHIKEVNISHKGNIGDYAFYDCDSVQSVEISNEGNVESQAFYDCDGILTATISNQGNIESQAFYDCDGIKSLDISNVGYVSDEAFRSCGALETAIVANTGAVNSSAFYDCVSLKSVTLGDKVTSLGNDAFRGCTSLQEIVIPNSVKSAGTYCFYGCTVMKSAVIGDGLTNVKEYTFANCGLEKIIIGDNITSIGNYAFKECRGMKSAVLGNGLIKVNGTMFNGCIGLENVEIGNKVTELEANAFSGCSSLKDVKIGSGVATINNYAFQGCSSLPTITIPQAVTKIGDNVFVGCSKLADVIIADRTEPLALGSNGSSALFVDCPLDSVYIGGKITYNTTSNMGYSPFYRNTSLRTVVITDREEQIYANEFYGCTNLQSVTIGNGVKSIGNYAFSGCSSLEGFSFGNSMESVGDEAFSDCTNLTSLTSYAAVPPTCGSQALDDINKWNCTLYIPTGSLAAYMAADQWKEFFFIEDNVTDGIEDIIMNDKQTEIIYDLQGRRVRNTDNLRGIYIINGKKTIK